MLELTINISFTKNKEPKGRTPDLILAVNKLI